ncbi:MAG: diguanylate cyclase [Chloroflexi bacterium]|nr:diguanylate cyclase [Chloroflexota bacterium]
MKFLVLSDDQQTHNFFNEIIDDRSYEMFSISGSDGIMSQMEKIQPDVLIADFDYPGLEGFELINGILASDLQEYPYIVFLTDPNQNKHVIDCLGPIPGDFVNRPLDQGEIEARLVIADRMISFKQQLLQKSGQSESLAIYDQLTSVLNRQAVYERALAEVNRAQRGDIQIGLAMVEIVNLSEIHKGYGAEVSNQTIRFVARAARANVRIYDIVGRWIGSKYLVLLPGIDEDFSKNIFERIQKAITTVKVKLPDGNLIDLDVRIGYVCLNQEKPEALYVLIEKANQALEFVLKEDKIKVLKFDK